MNSGARQRVGFEKGRGVYAINVSRNLAQVIVFTPDLPPSPPTHLQVFQAMAEAGVPIRLVKLHRQQVSFVLDANQLGKAQETLKGKGFLFETHGPLGILSAEAMNMRDLWGIMAEIAEALLEAKVEVLQTGDAHNMVHCLVREQDLERGRQALLKRFHLSAEGSVS